MVKKLVSLFLILTLFLAGCSMLPPNPIPSPETGAPTMPSTVPQGDLLENKTSVSSNLYLVNNPLIDELGTFSDLLIYKDCLLMSHMELPETEPAPDGEPPQVKPGTALPTDILLIDLQTGQLRAKTHLELYGGPMIHIAGDYIVVGSWDRGSILLLDENLKPVKEGQIDPSWSLNHVDASGRYGYSIPQSGVLIRTDLDTGTETILIDNALNLTVDSVNRYGAALNYVGTVDQRFHSKYLDLTTNELTDFPFPGSYAYASCVDGLWMADLHFTYNTYLVGRTDDPYVLKTPTGTNFQLIEGPAPLYASDYSDSYQQTLTVYQEDGSFYSQIQSSTDIGFCSQPIWCEARNGYFLSAIGPGDTNQLLFWDAGIPQEGKPLQMRHLSSIDWEAGSGSAVAQELYDRAAALSSRYGIDVRIADQCDTEYRNFHAIQVVDYFVIDEALDHLDHVLAAFPDGFIPQLQHGDLQKTQINLMGALQAQDIPEDAHGFTEFAGFVSSSDGRQVMVLNIALPDLEQTIYHEFSHMIDTRLDFAARYQDTLYNEARWASLNPPEFCYSQDVYHVPDNFYWDGLDNTFIDTYARTNATEDRARVFEHASVNHEWYFDPQFNAPLREKLAYYSACIREGFDTTGWPEETFWERPLKGYRFDRSILSHMDSIAESLAVG